MDFDAWFAKLAGGDVRPHPWQRALAAAEAPRSRLVRIPTGMGKTLGVLAAWSWHRLHRADDTWPRRLVWCLPMRVLVEQTDDVIKGALARVNALWNTGDGHAGKVGVHVLMGGADPGGEWHLYPEEAAVLIGTQDMLLSRALNRGYAAARARWPLEFGLLGHDVLWVTDEVQLMDVGLATSAQLQAYADKDASTGLRPRLTWWMSATLQPAWLKSVDTAPRHDDWCREPCVVDARDRGEGLGSIRKSLALAEVAEKDAKSFASIVLDEHGRLTDEGFGRITLVVCNTVERACRTFDALRTLGRVRDLELVHSRFRPHERLAWRGRFLSRNACVAGADRIIVATQVVEAGVDISAGCVVSELAPWSSLVQRFGRCARYGGTGRALVVDRGRDEKIAAPYLVEELDAARDAIARLAERVGDAGTRSIDDFEDQLSDDARRRLYPYEPKHLLLRRELEELFDTTPDLTGADLDVSRFIRSGDERDLQVFWCEIPAPSGKQRPRPDRRRRARREELCPVPFLAARDWLCGPETKSNRKPRLREGVRAWVWDWLDGEWRPAQRSTLTPGRIVCVAADVGGYHGQRGFDPRASEQVLEVPLAPLPLSVEVQELADESDEADDLSRSPEWQTIAFHGGEVSAAAQAIGGALGLPADLQHVLRLAGLWHDLGKAHPAFQGAIEGHGRPARRDLAKAPKEAWRLPYRSGDDARPGFRHELASALALFALLETHRPEHPALLGPWREALALIDGTSLMQRATESRPTAGSCEEAILACSADDFDLLAYLVAAHHGKVRVALHSTPKDQDYVARDDRGPPVRGVREGDELPAIQLDSSGAPITALRLTLEPATLGLSPRTGRSWRERTLGLVARYGPCTLAWLEAVLIAADRRVSKVSNRDPVLVQPDNGGPR